MYRNLISTIFKAVALGMGIATLVLNISGNLSVNTAITLLSIGVACLVIVMLQEK